MRDLYRLLGIPAYSLWPIIQQSLARRNDYEAMAARSILYDPAKKKAYDHAHQAISRIVRIRRELQLMSTPHWNHNEYLDWGPAATEDEHAIQNDGPLSSISPDDDKSVNRELKGRGSWRRIAIVCALLLIITLLYNNCDSSLDGSSGTESSELYPGPALSRPDHQTLFKDIGYADSYLYVNTNDGDDYFLKLVDATTKRTIRSAYLHGGVRGSIPVPSGTYLLYWNSGRVWYGPTTGFGPKSSKQRSRGTITFDSQSEWEVTLYPVPQGNMRNEEIDNDEFDAAN